MGTTSEFLKLRSSGPVKTGEWNIDFEQAMTKAKADGKFVIAAWSNGDMCSFCVKSEECMMTDIFKNWMKTVDAYFVFQCSDDKDKGKAVYDWVYSTHTINLFPGFRITAFNPKTGKTAKTRSFDGNTLRENKIKDAGAKAMVKNISAFISPAKTSCTNESKDSSLVAQDYKVRLNEKLTVAKVNKILDAIDKNDGYCPCQPRGEGTKCHCKDFVENKGIGEPCICNIYVKQIKDASAKTAKKLVKVKKPAKTSKAKKITSQKTK